MAAVGWGSASHLCGVYFQRNTGTHFKFVPYRGAGPAMQDLVAGQIDMMIDQAANSLPQVRAGTIKAFAVTEKTRLAAAPDIPTVDEAGLPGLYISIWHALWMPKGTPKDIIAKLNAAVVDTLADANVRKRLAELGQEIPPREQQTPEALRAYQKAEIEKWWPIIKAANIKGNEGALAAASRRRTTIRKGRMTMKAICGVVAALCLGLAAGQAIAQANYPEQPIRILVGFTPGVAPDITARLLGEKFTASVGQAGRGRERDRRRRQPRGRAPRQGRARRPHAGAGRQRLARHQSQPVRQAALRSAEGFRLHHADVHCREHPRGSPRRAGEQHPGADRARQGAAGLSHRRTCRHRHLAASRRRAVQDHGRRQHSAGAVPRHDRDPARSAGRAAQYLLRQYHQSRAAHSAKASCARSPSRRSSARRWFPICRPWRNWDFRASMRPRGSG